MVFGCKWFLFNSVFVLKTHNSLDKNHIQLQIIGYPYIVMKQLFRYFTYGVSQHTVSLNGLSSPNICVGWQLINFVSSDFSPIYIPVNIDRKKYNLVCSKWPMFVLQTVGRWSVRRSQRWVNIASICLAWFYMPLLCALQSLKCEGS